MEAQLDWITIWLGLLYPALIPPYIPTTSVPCCVRVFNQVLATDRQHLVQKFIFALTLQIITIIYNILINITLDCLSYNLLWGLSTILYSVTKFQTSIFYTLNQPTIDPLLRGIGQAYLATWLTMGVAVPPSWNEYKVYRTLCERVVKPWWHGLFPHIVQSPRFVSKSLLFRQRWRCLRRDSSIAVEERTGVVCTTAIRLSEKYIWISERTNLRMVALRITRTRSKSEIVIIGIEKKNCTEKSANKKFCTILKRSLHFFVSHDV